MWILPITGPSRAMKSRGMVVDEPETAGGRGSDRARYIRWRHQEHRVAERADSVSPKSSFAINSGAALNGSRFVELFRAAVILSL
jgi:hypothetical protein